MATADRPSPEGSSPPPGPAPSIGTGHPVPLDQSFDRDGLHRLRAAVAAHASALGTDEDALFHLLIIAGELAANAVRHGGGRGRLRLWSVRGHLHCQVSDAGSGIHDADRLGRTPAPPGAPGGRGLWIVRQLATTVTLDSSPRGLTVTATLPAWTPPG